MAPDTANRMSAVERISINFLSAVIFIEPPTLRGPCVIPGDRAPPAACARPRHPARRATSAPDPRVCRHDGFQNTSRSEEHTSELQSRLHLVCRLLLEKKKK